MTHSSSIPGHSDIVGQLAGVLAARGSYDTGGYGSIWDYDTPTGTVVRWDGTTYDVASDIRVTAPPIVRRPVPDLDRGRCAVRCG